MLRKVRPRSAYDVMAAISFFAVLAGGSAYAAATIGAANIKSNAIRSRHIKNGEVKNADLGANSVGSGKVIDGSLLKQDLKPGQLYAGPTQFNQQYSTHTASEEVPSVDGIEGLYATIGCNFQGGALEVSIHSVGDAAEVQLAGTESHDGVVTNVQRSGSSGYTWSANSTEDLDVLANNTSVGKWTRLDLGSYDGGSSGCNFWGMITPPAN